jgi:hypothetical protein
MGDDPTTDFDLYMSVTNPLPDWQASDHSSFTCVTINYHKFINGDSWGDEYTAFYMCPPPGLSSGNFYLNVYSWYPGNALRIIF